ncbi:MAG: hypothetical protein IKP61_01095 [Spirochaetales bacterium]|nr:hypothetical protein [Spirochaetales bacterium]
MADKKVSFDFSVITTVLVGILLVFVGISGFDSRVGDDLIRPLTQELLSKNEALIYIVCGLAAVSGLGILVCKFVSGMPPVVDKVCGIVAVAFWVLIIIARDVLPIDKKTFLLVIRDFSLDLLILAAILQSTIFSSKN